MTISETLLARDAEYRAALGVCPGAPLPSSIGTVAKGGTAASRTRARRSRASTPPPGVRLDALGV